MRLFKKIRLFIDALVLQFRESEPFRKQGTQSFWLFAIVSGVVLLAVFSLSVKHGLIGQYYNNPDWKGAPIMTARDAAPTLQPMRRKFPAHPDNYSIEWAGLVFIPVSGTYQFMIGSDDGSWLWLDNQLVVENGGYHAYLERSNTIALEQGFHPVKIRYMQGYGFAYLNIFWNRPGETRERIPPDFLFPKQPTAFHLAIDRVFAIVFKIFKWIWLICFLTCLLIFLTSYRLILPMLKDSSLGKASMKLLTWLLKEEVGKSAFSWLPAQQEMFSKWLWAILALSFFLNLSGIWWGLPSFRGWAPDELTPAIVQDGIAKAFSNGWFDKYPPFHYYLLTLVYTPVFILNWLHIVDIQSFTIYTTLFYSGRLLSVLMGTATVFMVYLCGRELYEKRASLFAAFITALIAPFNYYAKIANLDVPYIFWFICSLYFYIRILKHHRLADYLLFATMAVLSVCTKDQAYGLYVLMPIPIIVSRYQEIKGGNPFVRFFGAAVNRQTLLSLLWAIILFLGIHNIVFNLYGFIIHVKIITGPASEGYKVYENTLAGHTQMFWQSLKHIRFSFGLPLYLTCLVGLVVELFKKKKNNMLFALLIPGLSYYLFFISVILYNYDRFFIPICIILAFFGGQCLSDFLSGCDTDVIAGNAATKQSHLSPSPDLSPSLRNRGGSEGGVERGLKGEVASLAMTRPAWIGKVLCISGIFLYTLFYSASIDILMVYDSRYYVESWLEKHADHNAVIGLVGLGEYLPEARKFPRKEYMTNPSVESVKRLKPDYLIINADVRWGNKEFFTLLNDGKLGYALILQYRTDLHWLFLHRDDMVQNSRKVIFTNFDKINPEIRVFKRTD